VKWNELSLMQVGQFDLEAHSKEWAFVVLLFLPPSKTDHLDDFLLAKEDLVLSAVGLLDTTCPPTSIQRNDQFLTFLFSSPSEALTASLLLLATASHIVNIGVGYGAGYMLDYFQSIELLRLKSVLPFGDPHEIQMSPSLQECVPMPSGVGAFQCSPALAQATGMHYWIVKDYRTP
jgi:hypothetical protein